MRLTANNLAMIAAVALAPTIVTPAASATVGISRPTNSRHAACTYSVQYGTPRGVSVARGWGNELPVPAHEQALAACERGRRLSAPYGRGSTERSGSPPRAASRWRRAKARPRLSPPLRQRHGDR